MNEPSGEAPRTLLPDFPDDYRFAMSGAHRKPAYEVGAPSITWHLAFWNTYEVDYDSKTKSSKRRSEWIESIEMLILHVYHNLRKHKVLKCAQWAEPALFNLQPFRGQPDYELRLLQRIYNKDSDSESGLYEPIGYLDRELTPDHDSRHSDFETVHIDAVWNSMPIDIRFEVPDEFFTITLTIDFSRMMPQPRTGGVERRRRRRRSEFDLENETFRSAAGALYLVTHLADQRFSELTKGHTSSFKDQAVNSLTSCAEHLYFDIWKSLEEDIFRGNSDLHAMGKLGKRFADFRNLSLQCNKTGSALINPWKEDSERHLIEIPREETSLRDRIVNNSLKDDGLVLDWVDAIHPILLSVEPKEVNFLADASVAADPVEYTFTRFCDKRCIYGSGFGPQVEDDLKKGDPLTNIVLFGFGERREMGRMLLRLNSCGTLRLAALHEIRATKQEYALRLDDIEGALIRLHPKLLRLFDDIYGRPGEEEESPELKEKINGLMAEIERERVPLHRDLIELDGSSCQGSKMRRGLVQFRAARSRYYLDRFKVLARGLQSDPIMGYQLYETFIENRLNRAYSIFQLVGQHYSQLREKELEFRKELMALRSERHQRKLQADQEEIRHLQTTAEVFFIAVLLPYYLSHTVISAIESKGDTAKRWIGWLYDYCGFGWLHHHFGMRFGWINPMEHGEPNDFLVVFCSYALALLILVFIRYDIFCAFVGDFSRKIARFPAFWKRKLALAWGQARGAE